jgi:hypothetical protein
MQFALNNEKGKTVGGSSSHTARFALPRLEEPEKARMSAQIRSVRFYFKYSTDDMSYHRIELKLDDG